VVLFKNETSRHKADHEMVGHLNSKEIASYNYLGTDFNEKNEEAIHEKIRADGFDGAITMRLIDVEQEPSYPYGGGTFYSPYNQSFGGFYFRNWPYYSNPNYYFATKVYTVETNVYSIKEKKIIWTGLTKSEDTPSLEFMNHVNYS
jgi:hypothetical protein